MFVFFLTVCSGRATDAAFISGLISSEFTEHQKPVSLSGTRQDVRSLTDRRQSEHRPPAAGGRPPPVSRREADRLLLTSEALGFKRD